MTTRARFLKNNARLKEEKINEEIIYNEKTFYKAFVKDVFGASKEVIIYSPFISKFRSEYFFDTFKTLRKRNVNIFIFTRPIEEHSPYVRVEIQEAINHFEEMGVIILYLPGSIHEKVAIIDRKIIWEGSLNILSQRTSHELMRRTFDEYFTKQVMFHLDINKKLAEAYEQIRQNLIKNRAGNHKNKTCVFFVWFLILTLICWLFFNFRAMISVFEGVQLILNLIKSY